MRTCRACPTLATVLAGSLAGRHTLTGISEFRARPRLSSGPYDAPGISTLHYILKRLDADAFDAEFDDWLDAQAEPAELIMIAGKTLLGSYDRDFGPDGHPLDKPVRHHVPAVGIDWHQVIARTACTGRKEDAVSAALRRLAEDLDGPDAGVCRRPAREPAHCCALAPARSRVRLNGQG